MHEEYHVKQGEEERMVVHSTRMMMLAGREFLVT